MFLAGSYISSIMCGPAEFGSPFAVRRTVLEALRDAELGRTARVALRMGREDKLCNVTNWTGIYYHLELPGCDHIVHFPINASEQDVFFANLYLFRPRPEAVAALIFEAEGVGDGAAEVRAIGGPLRPWGLGGFE